MASMQHPASTPQVSGMGSTSLHSVDKNPIHTETDSRAETAIDGSDQEGENDPVEQFEREAYGPLPGEKGWDQFEVSSLPEDDPANPKSWSRPYRWYLTMLGGLLVLNATFASSVPEGIIEDMMEYFSFSQEVATLTISLFVAGYCIGPLLWGPLSEQIGRRIVFIVSFAVYTCFQVGTALSRNTASILVFRFLGGCFAAAPLSNSGAIISDVWDAGTRGQAMAFFTLAPFAGPTLGPIVSGFMADAGVDWRWVYWLLTCFAGANLLLIIFTLPETFLPILLVECAKQKRKETGDNRYWAPLERQNLKLIPHIKHILSRPFVVLFYEPMLIAITLYMSFVYGCIYILFEAYPIVFQEGHDLNTGIFGLTFLPVFIGGCTGVATYLLIFNPRYIRAQQRFAPAPVPPEFRLEIAMCAAPVFVIAFFWFGWTSYPSVSIWAPMLAGFPLGLSIIWIFLALFNYMIDAYLWVAASALAANTIVRSAFGAGFPEFATQMFERLDPRWASTLIGGIAILLGPIPFVLYRYGPVIRRRSRFAPTKPPASPVKEAEDTPAEV